MPDLRIKQIADRTGLSTRYWQDRAARGEIPGTSSHKCGKRHIFFIDEEQFNAWYTAQRTEVRPCQSSSAGASTGGKGRTARGPRYGGGGYGGKAKNSTDPSILKLKRLLANA